MCVVCDNFLISFGSKFSDVPTDLDNVKTPPSDVSFNYDLSHTKRSRNAYLHYHVEKFLLTVFTWCVNITVIFLFLRFLVIFIEYIYLLIYYEEVPEEIGNILKNISDSLVKIFLDI